MSVAIVSSQIMSVKLSMPKSSLAIIFISHRLSTTRMADKVYLFENGSIIEQGTHDELMNLGGKYKEMFDRQAHNYIL